MYSYTPTQYYYSACGHGDHQNHPSDIFSESQALNPCSPPGKYELVENRVCWQCWHCDFESSPLPLADRESETIKFLLFKGQVDLYHSETNQQNKVLEEELCILTLESRLEGALLDIPLSLLSVLSFDERLTHAEVLERRFGSDCVEFEIQHDPERTANRMREEFETTARDEYLDDEEEDRENRATDDFLEDYFNPGLDWATIFTPVSSTDIPADYREDDSEDDESFDGYHDGEFNETTVSQALVSVPIKDVLDEDRQCSICKEAYGCSEGNMEAPEEPVKLSCGHIFGFVCATAWLYIGSRHQDCPMCRRRR
ncbi:hypothetical protein V8E51_009864 [Hyaloscypha variabilis]